MMSKGSTTSAGSLMQAESYSLLVNSIQDYAIFFMDTSGRIRSWNLGAEKLKQYKPKEIIGKHFSIFYEKKDIEANKPGKELEVCNECGHVEDEGWRLKKDGSRFWASVVITALRDEKGALLGYAKVTRDLTERKKHEDELHKTNKILKKQSSELSQLNTTKDEFISLASHQLRTPASGVKQFLGLLLEGYAGPLTERQTDYVRRAYESNDRQIDLVNDLLRVAQVDAGKVVLTKTVVDLNALIQDVIDEQIDSFKQRKQTVSLKFPAKSYRLHVDELRFRMVLDNIIDNASKYTPVGGTITISVARKKGFIYVSIHDDGVGISSTSLPKLFSKFSRIHNELSEDVGGSGLGLYWAYKIVALHGGDIKATSQVGKGSNFTISIPLERSYA